MWRSGVSVSGLHNSIARDGCRNEDGDITEREEDEWVGEMHVGKDSEGLTQRLSPIAPCSLAGVFWSRPRQAKERKDVP